MSFAGNGAGEPVVTAGPQKRIGRLGLGMTTTAKGAAMMDRMVSAPAESGSVATDVLSMAEVLGESDEQDWHERALCAQTDPEAFFPEKGGSTREAKRICSGCEVRAECLEYALAHDERFGIWGGMSERERRRLKRRAC